MSFALLLSALLVCVIIYLVSKYSEKQNTISDLTIERNSLEKRLKKSNEELKEAMENNTNPATENDSKDFWAGVYKNRTINTIRVNDRMFKKLLADAEFLVNASGYYKNIKGMYRGSKVMMKLPTRKVKNANSNTKTK